MVSGIRSFIVATSATLLPSESQRIVWARSLHANVLHAWPEKSVVLAVLNQVVQKQFEACVNIC